MKEAKIFFNPVEGSGPLTINWFAGPKGDAIEAISGEGVGFFSPSGDLLGVVFDDVISSKDVQVLNFENGTRVSILVQQGEVELTEVFLPDMKHSAS